jgi:TolA-binding protein
MGDVVALWVGVAVSIGGLLAYVWRAATKFAQIQSSQADDRARLERLERKFDSDVIKLETQMKDFRGEMKDLRAEANAGFASIHKTLTDILFKMGDNRS